MYLSFFLDTFFSLLSPEKEKELQLAPYIIFEKVSLDCLCRQIPGRDVLKVAAPPTPTPRPY